MSSNYEDFVKCLPFYGKKGNYYNLKNIGTGQSSRVFLVKNEETGKEYALKLFDHDELFEKEIGIYGSLEGSKFVPRLIDSSRESSNKKFIVLEKLGGTLRLYTPKTIEKVYEIFETVAEAIVDIHERGIYHRDIHLGNMMFSQDEKPVIKLVDFEMAEGLDSAKKIFLRDYRGYLTAMNDLLRRFRVKNNTTTQNPATEDLYNLFQYPKSTMEKQLEELKRLRKKHIAF